MFALEEGEKIEYEIRKHWFFITTEACLLLFFACLPIIFFIGFVAAKNINVTTDLITLGCFFYFLWFSALWIFFFIEWTDYYLDVWVITNHRIVDIDHVGLFSRDVSTVRLEDIEDITTELHGILAITLKFGTITLQTAGSRDEFYLYNANDPEKTKERIYALMEKRRSKE